MCVHAHVCLQVSMHLGMRVGGQPQGPSCLHHSGVVIKHALPRLAFSVGAGDLNSGPCACKHFNNSHLPRIPKSCFLLFNGSHPQTWILASSPSMERLWSIRSRAVATVVNSLEHMQISLSYCLTGRSRAWLGRAHSPSQREAVHRLTGHPF